MFNTKFKEHKKTYLNVVFKTKLTAQADKREAKSKWKSLQNHKAILYQSCKAHLVS